MLAPPGDVMVVTPVALAGYCLLESRAPSKSEAEEAERSESTRARIIATYIMYLTVNVSAEARRDNRRRQRQKKYSQMERYNDAL
jgi:hypothetical protein